MLKLHWNEKGKLHLHGILLILIHSGIAHIMVPVCYKNIILKQVIQCYWHTEDTQLFEDYRTYVEWGQPGSLGPQARE